MAVKLFLPYRCPRCEHGHKFEFWRDGSVRNRDWHRCPSAPPGPADPPREYRQGTCGVQVDGALTIRSEWAAVRATLLEVVGTLERDYAAAKDDDVLTPEARLLYEHYIDKFGRMAKPAAAPGETGGNIATSPDETGENLAVLPRKEKSR